VEHWICGVTAGSRASRRATFRIAAPAPLRQVSYFTCNLEVDC